MYQFASNGFARRMARFALYLAVTLGALVASDAGRAAGIVRPMIINGPAQNRVDLVVLGDGYLATEMSKFRTDAATVVSRFLNEPPFSSYKKYFNVRRINTPSATSGASHTGSPGGTYYGSYYNCFGIARLLCVDGSRVTAELTASLTPAERDIVLVVVNDAEYGGSGGQYAVTSTHPSAPEIAIHELGHSFGRLDDEYVDSSICGRTPLGGFNVTQATVRTNIPWAKWIPKSAVVPTPPGGAGVGLYAGALYCSSGWYRPTPDSKMRSLGQLFYQVNGEQLIRRIYAFTSTVDSVSPAPGALRIEPGTTRTFTATRIVPGSTNLIVAWRLDGVLLSTADSVTVSADQLAGASKTLSLVVRDKTLKVLNDPSSALIDQFQWTLNP